MANKKKVSVCMITYCHEKFIAEAINGVLMQECDFEVELILANDCSPDKTDFVIQNILVNHPKASWIRYINHKENLGMIPNFIFAMQQCRGEYIALCEGDDYWTDPLKLRKQVGFLEENPDYNICFHKVKTLKNNSLHEDVNIEKRYNSITDLPATVNDLIKQGNFMHTASVMYRSDEITFPFELSYSSVGDYFMHIIVSKKGHIKRIDETMAVYRDGVGIYSTLSYKEMQKEILNYQICVLSYLEEPDQKKILLQKVLKSINDLSRANILNDKNLSTQLRVRQLIKIISLKIKRKFK